jgi:hypothetical protein
LSDRGWELKVVVDPPEHRRTRRGRTSRRRLLVVFVVVAVVVSIAVTDKKIGRPATSGLAGSASLSGTDYAVSSPSAESSAWFCVAGSQTGTTAVVTLQMTNPTKRVVAATVSSVAVGGETSTKRVTLPALGQLDFAPAVAGAGPWVGSTVLVDGGGVGVSELSSGPLGWSSAPCNSSTSDRWYFAQGSTGSGATLSLLLYNPAPTDSVVDVSLDESDGTDLQPPAYQGLPVPAGALVVENLGDHLLDTASFATEVTTTSGAVVAAELQTIPQIGGGGSSLLAGVSAPSKRWDFPQNLDPPSSGSAVAFYLFNPSGATATVKADVALAQGQAEPISVTVRARSVSELLAENQTRIPAASPYAMTFSSDVGIVVDREVAAAGARSSPQIGQVHGVSRASSRYVLPALALPARAVSSLTVSDVRSAPVKVTVTDMKTGEVVDAVVARVVTTQRPLFVTPAPGSGLGNDALLVIATGPVAVELDASPVGAAGVVVVPALPLS